MAKSLNNSMSAMTLAGIDSGKLVEIINASSGRSYSTEVKFPRYVLNRAFDDGFAIRLMDEDLRIALDTAGELEIPTVIGSAVGRVWEAAASEGFGSESHTAIYAFIEKMMEQASEKEEQKRGEPG